MDCVRYSGTLNARNVKIDGVLVNDIAALLQLYCRSRRQRVAAQRRPQQYKPGYDKFIAQALCFAVAHLLRPDRPLEWF